MTWACLQAVEWAGYSAVFSGCYLCVQSLLVLITLTSITLCEVQWLQGVTPCSPIHST